MKAMRPDRPLLKTIVFLIIAICLIPGCSSINEVDVKAKPIENSSHKYDLVFQKKDYSKYLLDFISQADQVVLSGPGDVYIFDLKTGKLVKQLPTPNSQITACHVSKNGTRLFLFTTQSMQAWNTTEWTLSKQLEATKYHPNRQSGFSKNGELLYFADAIWSSSTFEKICENIDDPVPNDYDFSPDLRYFVTAGHFGIPIIDIKEQKWSGISYLKKDATQVSFRDNNSFYASYGAKLDITKGGYLPEELGLFDVKEKHILETFSPSARISCWVNNPKAGLLVSLYNGDIYLLNHQLDIRYKWHIDDYVNVCSQANNGDIWLGSKKTGLYKADLAKLVISHEYQTNNAIFKLKISSDGRYLAFEEMTPDKTLTNVFNLNK